MSAHKKDPIQYSVQEMTNESFNDAYKIIETVGAADVTNTRTAAFNRLQTETTNTQPAIVTNTRNNSTFNRTQTETTNTAPATVTNTRTAQFNRTQTENLTAGGGTMIVKIFPVMD